ncbi:unnamed protein product [Macrosiphum euphorbiae]|uniref:Uncharacterized protein n=1 Tax=Macrosiphum euphorbiae TaxID=13131 RepID=A0AAV0WNP6_9HEMI|nr:unnamed protein product [Macrosiphum euphorbiae]
MFRCRDFFVVAAIEMTKRYNMADPVLSQLVMLKPQNAISHSFRETSPTLLPLIKSLPRIVSDTQQMQEIDDEWRSLPSAHYSLKFGV